MAQTITGGCHCGAVRYRISADPAFTGNCYCEDCRKMSGSGHVTILAVLDQAVAVTGKLTEYTSPGGSSQPVTRRFCPKCGARVSTSATALPGLTLVTASTLDDPTKFTSQMSVFASRAPSWDQPPQGLPAFAEMPPQA